jgi:hypothetical protein
MEKIGEVIFLKLYVEYHFMPHFFTLEFKGDVMTQRWKTHSIFFEQIH